MIVLREYCNFSGIYLGRRNPVLNFHSFSSNRLHAFFIRKLLFCLSLNSLTFPYIEAEIFLTFIGVNWLKEVTIIVIKSLIFVNQDYQRKFRSL